MQIRDFVASDLDGVYALNEAGVPGVHAEPKAVLAEIAQQSAIALVAEMNGEIAGFCLVLAPGARYASLNYAWFCQRYDDFIYLDRVAVSPQYRSGGIGGRLYQEVEARTRAAWFTLEVNLRPRNDGSLRFHGRQGFVEVGQQETEYGALVSLMAKRLR